MAMTMVMVVVTVAIMVVAMTMVMVVVTVAIMVVAVAMVPSKCLPCPAAAACGVVEKVLACVRKSEICFCKRRPNLRQESDKDCLSVYGHLTRRREQKR